MTPIMYLHFTLQPSSEIGRHVPNNCNAFAYVVSGNGYFGKDGQSAEEGQMVIFAGDGEKISIKASADSENTLDALLLAGLPLKEPIAQYGLFVINTGEEIDPAIEDHRSGRMGKINSV